MKIKNLIVCFARLLASLFLLLGFIAEGLLLHIPRRSRSERRKATVKMVSIYCRRVLAVLNVRVAEEYPHGQDPHSKPVVLISNHLSFLDIFILAARYPAIFITSTELRDSFLLGQISRLSGSLFVNRRNPRQLHQEMAEIKEVLDDQLSVAFFPESKSSNGDNVLPFRSALFSIPLAMKIPILPVVLNYKALNGVYDPAGFKNNVFYFGDQNFFVQLWRVLNTDSIDITLSYLPLETFSEVTNENDTRHVRAKGLHKRISSNYKSLQLQKVG